ncbi:MAG: TIR domain-containing protein, partial [Planctomycetota bacterium]
MVGHLFISYSHKNRDYVECLARALTDVGREVWFDSRLTAGRSWTKEVEEHIRTACAVVLVATPDSVGSDFVEKELHCALEFSKPIVPVLLDKCRLPFLIKGVHYIAAQGNEIPVRAILDALAEHERLAANSPAAGPEGSVPAGPPRPSVPSNAVPVNDALGWLAEKLREGKLALLVGPVASASAGLPLRDRLVGRLRKELRREDPDFDDLAELASWFVDTQQLENADQTSPRRILLQMIVELHQECRRERQHDDFGQIYPPLARLPVRNIYNANWDALLETYLLESGPSAEPIQVFDNLRPLPPPAAAPERHLVYMHGRLIAPDSLMVASYDFAAYEPDKPQHIVRRLQQEFDAGTVLLCVGFSYADLGRVAEYLSRARAGRSTPAPVYAVFSQLSPLVAGELYKRHRICPIVLGGVPERGATLLAQFLGILNEHQPGETISFIAPDETGIIRTTKGQAAVDRRMKGANVRLNAEGLKSAQQWFLNFPDDGLPVPPPPPTAAVDAVFVDRGMEGDGEQTLKQWVKEQLNSGQMAGITGLLGMGGVGKTYLALRVAWEMYREGWPVVWVSLQEKEAGEALDEVAKAYGLQFVGQLKEEEKVLALRWLFEYAADHRTLIVLDNAERFPNLLLVLQALYGLPVLITSRTEECVETVTYRRLQELRPDESLSLCRQLLARSPDGNHLSQTDEQDVVELCRHLGGHPLGIKLAIAGFLKMPRQERLGERPFHRVLNQIKAKGAEALPESGDVDSGKAGEGIHRTVFSTFEWLFKDLGKEDSDDGLSPLSTVTPETIFNKELDETDVDETDVDDGLRAKLLLPLIAVLGASPVSAEMLQSAVANFIERFVSAESERGESVPPEEEGPPPPPLGVAAADQEGFDTEDVRVLQLVGNYRFGSISSLVSCDGIVVAPHPNTQFDERVFLAKLRSSISLSLDNKFRILQAIPNLSQFQIDELQNILDEEFWKFSCLPPKHLLHLKKLEEMHSGVWGLIRLSLSERSKCRWFNEFLALKDPQKLRAAWNILEGVALIETEIGTGLARIHPLIREFAFTERSRARSLIVPGADISAFTVDGPSIEAILACGVTVLGDNSENAPSLLDLVPRIKRFRQLAPTVSDKLWDWYDKVYWEKDQWILARRLLEAGVELGRSVGGIEKFGRFLAKLGELLDRMEFAEGLALMRESLPLLNDRKDRKAFRAGRWASAFVHKNEAEADALPHVRNILTEFRSILSDNAVRDYVQFISLVEGHLSLHLEETPCNSQLDVKLADQLLANQILELGTWVERFCYGQQDDEQLGRAKGLFAKAFQRLEKGTILESKTSNDVITPERSSSFRATLLEAVEHCATTCETDLEKEFGELLDIAQKAGIRGFGIQSSKLYCHWVRAVRAQNWSEALTHALERIKVVRANSHHKADYSSLAPCLHAIATRLADSPTMDKLSAIEMELRQIEEHARYWG